jgi:hypothetical protein
MSEDTYWERTEPFKEKLRLLEAAWQRKDFRLARALTHSLRSTAMQAQVEEEHPGTPQLPVAQIEPVDGLPAPWKEWARRWKYCRTLHLDDTLGVERPAEPVEVLLSVPAEQAESLAREIRVARVRDGALAEVPCQVHGEVRRGSERRAKVLFMAGGAAHERQTYLVFHGNPDAELPAYPTDLQTRGEGFALEPAGARRDRAGAHGDAASRASAAGLPIRVIRVIHRQKPEALDP